MRRLRRTVNLRDMVRETRLSPSQLIYPIFVHETTADEPIPSMPGQSRLALASLKPLAASLRVLGLPAVMVFGIPARKDESGSEAWNPEGIVQRAVVDLKAADPNLLVITDTCLDEYTSHGHCGVVRGGEVDNDATIAVLSRIAVSQAEAGADMVAPSDMMDGRVAAIRSALDTAAYSHIPIMSYAAKFASTFYGPFRDAADCAPKFGDRRSYQMDPANRREALREVVQDVQEGADIIMVKPALPYLDIIAQTRDAVDVPVAAFNVSGEYAMVKAAAEMGFLDERAVVLETLVSVARAGADLILTYHAPDAARWLQEQ